MNDREYRKERRRQARLERLGCNDPFCIIDGEDDPRVLQAHHPGGHKYTNATVLICLNHHGAEELRKDHPPELSTDPDALECDGRHLLGLADLLSLLEVPPEIVELIRQAGFRLIEAGLVGAHGDQP